MQNGETFKWLAQAGYAARGIVFFLVAGLAIFSGFSSHEADTKPALNALLEQPLGRIWVGTLAIGLFGFVCWRLAQSLSDADGHGAGGKGLAIRAALLGSAVTYLGLATYALTHSIGLGSGGSGSGEKSLAQWVMGQPFGAYLAMAIGVGFLIGGGITIYKGAAQKFRKYLRLSEGRRSPVILMCVYGLIARGVVFAIVGGFLVYAGITVDPDQAGSISDALNWVGRLPFGSALYLIVAAGLAAFGFYNLVEARYRIVRSPSVSDVKKALPV